MDSLELKLQNTEAFVGLVGDHSIARAGDTSKYFLRTTGSEPERVFVDGCTSDAKQLFAIGGLQSYIEHAISGGTSALFVSGSGITQPSDYDRSHLLRDMCTAISTTMTDSMTITYAFLGITDHKVIDFHNDRTVSTDKIRRGLRGLHHEVDDWAVLEEKIQKGATLPYVLSLRFESMDGPTSGHLCIVDMHVVSWTGELAQSVLQKSVNGLASLVRLMGSHDRVLTGCTVDPSSLLCLTGDLLASNSKTAFVFYLNTSECTDLDSTISMISTVRKLRTTLVRSTADRRVQLFYEKAHYYQQEKYRLQASLDSSLAATEQVERDLDDVQQGFSAERVSLHEEVEHWQQKTKELEEALNGLRNESEGAEADARWTNARLVTEKLGLRDELRRMEVEAAMAEDARGRIMDVHEALVDAHEALDTAYTELLNSYTELRGRCRHLVDVRERLETQINELEDQAIANTRHSKQLESQITEQSTKHSRAISSLETLRANDAQTHSQIVKQLESRLEAQATRLASTIDELAMGQAQSATQTEETKGLRATIARLDREIATSEQTSSANLHTAMARASRLEAQVERLTSTIDEMRTSRESNDNTVEREQAEWARERERMQKKMAKLQKEVEQVREQAEVRDVGETRVSHDKYLALKQKLRQAVEFAADVQAKLDAERPDEIVSDEPTVVKQAPRRARATVPTQSEDPANTNGDAEPVDSDDSEISFNPRAMSPITRPKPKPRKPRAKRPARKTADESTEPAQPVRSKPTNTRSKRTRNGTSNAEAVASAPEPTQIVNEPSVPRVSALKKKRKLNLSRMRSLLGMQPTQPTELLHAVKFSVPKIRAVADEGPVDSD
ncbi:hypothetical protein GGH12_005390 [Coemansia sp. RSA 1822]|nr:hypothetical protein LPJ76_005518 [Coemansia sp. RSA 638]KAJ2539419.1 hypothetical protein GGF49_005227 [Coemansia sp. RSA 1853]KAJ2559453.1 hypothetical protein GGH12_005390 [Coemansia sp. RSA 1822]